MKTLEKWLDEQRGGNVAHGFECVGVERMRQVWDAAQSAEREECAAIAEGLGQHRDWFPTSLWASLRNEIGARIRMRSNVEVTGAAHE